MTHHRTAAIIVAALIVAGGTARAQAPAEGQDTPAPPPERERPARRLPPLGPNLGLFAPTSTMARDRFGSTWVAFGLGLGGVRPARRGGGLVGDFGAISGRRGDNRALIIPLGVEWRTALGGAGSSGDEGEERPGNVPYVGVAVDAYATRLRSDEDGVRAGWRFAGGGGAALGVTFAQRGFVEARYRIISKIRGIDLSGAQVRAGVRF
jgi:hypothetical protein